MLWFSLYFACVIIIGVFLLIAEFSCYDLSDRPKFAEIAILLIFSPFILIVSLFKLLIELTLNFVSKAHYFSRFWHKQTVGILISDVRCCFAVNGKLRPEKKPIVYKDYSDGKMVYAGGYISSQESTCRVYPISHGVVCHYNEMNFLVESLLKDIIPLFSFKTIYNIGIPVVTSASERTALINSFKSNKTRTFLIPELISSILNESNFGLIYLAHSFTEITTVENNLIKDFASNNIGLDELILSIIKRVCPSVKTGFEHRRNALEAIMSENYFKLYGPDMYSGDVLDVTLTIRDLKKHSKQWISSIKNLLMKLPSQNLKWYVISDYGTLNDIATLISDECSVKAYPINNSHELLAKKLSLIHV